jgi:hypothetical protein
MVPSTLHPSSHVSSLNQDKPLLRVYQTSAMKLDTSVGNRANKKNVLPHSWKVLIMAPCGSALLQLFFFFFLFFFEMGLGFELQALYLQSSFFFNLIFKTVVK